MRCGAVDLPSSDDFLKNIKIPKGSKAQEMLIMLKKALERRALATAESKLKKSA